MTAYTVSDVAKMTGVSVRTLHHYDHIELLKPSARTEAGYRLYEEKDLLRLQQILFFKELDVPLDEIRWMLDDPGFDHIEALKEHRRRLQNRAARLTTLLKTIDKTILKLTEDTMTMSIEELYEGFTPEQMAEYRREAQERWGDEVAATEERLRRMPKADWQALKIEGEAITRDIAALMDKDPTDPVVQTQIARHHAMTEQFYPVSAERYRGLGQLYVEDERFRVFYDKVRLGLADFMQAAMAHYAEQHLNEA